MGAIDFIKQRYFDKLRFIMHDVAKSHGYADARFANFDGAEEKMTNAIYDFAEALSEAQIKSPYLELIREMFEWLKAHPHPALAPELQIWELKAAAVLREQA